MCAPGAHNPGPKRKLSRRYAGSAVGMGAGRLLPLPELPSAEDHNEEPQLAGLQDLVEFQPILPLMVHEVMDASAANELGSSF